MSETVHASAVLAGSNGILIRGPSGSGKSLVAAQLINNGARLIADDRVFLSACHGRVIASAPAALRGLLELRGRGIVAVVQEASALIRLVVDLVAPEELERLPEQTALTADLLGVTLPRQPAPAGSAHALILVDAALRALPGAAAGLATSPTLGIIAPLSPHTAIS
jgi:HPr kinase/phosphorylase